MSSAGAAPTAARGSVRCARRHHHLDCFLCGIKSCYFSSSFFPNFRVLLKIRGFWNKNGIKGMAAETQLSRARGRKD